MPIVLHDTPYEFAKEVRVNPELREGFIQLTKETFGIDFHSWFEIGYWGDAFQPYVLTFQGKVVASVCVNLLFERGTSINHEGEPITHLHKCVYPKKLFVQLGGVITAEEHRGKGLSRWLLNTVLEEWQNKANGIYLYANDSVLDFYPKFGFEKVLEVESSIIAFGPEQPMKKLDPYREEDRNLIKLCYGMGNPYAAFQVEYFNLIMFYLLKPYKDCIYYLPEQQMLIIAKQEGDAWYCLEILGMRSQSLTQLLGCLNPNRATKVHLGFQPTPSLDCVVQPLHEEDTTFFVFRGKEIPFTEHQGRMPVLSRA